MLLLLGIPFGKAVYEYRIHDRLLLHHVLQRENSIYLSAQDQVPILSMQGPLLQYNNVLVGNAASVTAAALLWWLDKSHVYAANKWPAKHVPSSIGHVRPSQDIALAFGVACCWAISAMVQWHAGSCAQYVCKGVACQCVLPRPSFLHPCNDLEHANALQNVAPACVWLPSTGSIRFIAAVKLIVDKMIGCNARYTVTVSVPKV